MSPALLFGAAPRAAHWRLGPLPPEVGEMALIGWSGFSSVDAGVPAEAAELLSAAFASCARVTFPMSSPPVAAGDGWTDADGDQVRRLPDSLADRALATLTGRPAAMTLLSARTRERVCLMFDDPLFAWDAQATAAVLSPALGPPPDLAASDWRSLLSETWTRAAGPLASAGVAAVVRPGVDGDLFGLWSLDPAFADKLREALRREAQQRGFAWGETDEEQFAARLG